MATITARKGKKGTRYTAQIRLREKGKIIYTESETFDKRRLAEQWAKRRETELAQPTTLEKARHRGITIKQVLEWYRDDFDGLSKFGRSKLSHINYLINHPEFCELDALSLTSSQLVAHATRRQRVDKAMPATINNDFIWLSNAFRAVRIGRNIPLEQQVVDDAMFLCRKEGIIGKSKARERRPTREELEQLLTYFEGQRRGHIPMVDVLLFALFSTRRQDEICRIRWADLDEERRRVLVRDMKHPREKVDTWCFLSDRAWAIIQRQNRDKEFIFPFNGKSISTAFTRACKLLGIEDLRFHDLRHEGASHLFELGWDIPRVAAVTGHRSWTALQRYTHLQEHGTLDRYEKWQWLRQSASDPVDQV